MAAVTTIEISWAAGLSCIADILMYNGERLLPQL